MKTINDETVLIDKDTLNNLMKALFKTDNFYIIPTLEPVKKESILYNREENRFYKTTKEFENGIENTETQGIVKIGIESNYFDIDILKKKLTNG